MRSGVFPTDLISPQEVPKCRSSFFLLWNKWSTFLKKPNLTKWFRNVCKRAKEQKRRRYARGKPRWGGPSTRRHDVRNDRKALGHCTRRQPGGAEESRKSTREEAGCAADGAGTAGPRGRDGTASKLYQNNPLSSQKRVRSLTSLKYTSAGIRLKFKLNLNARGTAWNIQNSEENLRSLPGTAQL